MKYFLTVLTLITLNSCGPSGAEIAVREQFKTDSITKSAQEQLLRQQAEARRRSSLKRQLIKLKSQLAGAATKLQSIEGFTFLRTQDEKAQQVTYQVQIIEEIKAKIEEVNMQINE